MYSCVFQNIIYNSNNEENNDYIHLIYDFNYDKEIPDDIYKKIISDIKERYTFIMKIIKNNIIAQ